MGKCRFLYDNFITEDTAITVSSLRTGIVTTAKKDGTGSAVITTSGNYSGSEDLEYIVEIDSVGGGAEVGQATFKWSAGGGSWDASGVTTPAVATELNNGVFISFASGSGADFVVGDKWYFKGLNLYNAEKMIDRNRDSSCRSAALGAPNTIAVDLGSAREVKALIIYDHNFTAAATLLLEADDAATFDSDGGSAQFSEAVTWADDKILHYLSAATTKRHWRLSVTDAGNTDGFIDIAELYLGSYMELSRNYTEGFKKGFELLFDSNKTPYGVLKKRFFNRQRTFQFDFNCIAAADITLLETMIDVIAVRSTGVLDPFWFNDDSAVSANCWLVDVAALPEDHRTRALYDASLQLTEVMRSI